MRKDGAIPLEDRRDMPEEYLPVCQWCGKELRSVLSCVWCQESARITRELESYCKNVEIAANRYYRICRKLEG